MDNYHFKFIYLKNQFKKTGFEIIKLYYFKIDYI
jgi:hypothetical protein